MLSLVAWRVRRESDYRNNMPRLKGSISVAVVALLLACARGGGSPTPAASPLTLKIVFAKPEFFEGEPIYALFELRNAGSDTVRIPPFGVNARWLAAVLHRADGSVVPGGRGMWVEYACVKTCNGDPLAPAGARYEALIVQELWGTWAASIRDVVPRDRYGDVHA